MTRLTFGLKDSPARAVQSSAGRESLKLSALGFELRKYR